MKIYDDYLKTCEATSYYLSIYSWTANDTFSIVLLS